MKTIFVFIAWIVFTASAFSEGQSVGRYQLISGTVDFTMPGNAVETQARVILRIDTQTGKTWRYFFGTVNKDGKLKEVWSEIQD